MATWRFRWAAVADARAVASLWHRVWHWTYARHLQPESLKYCGVRTFERRISVSLFEHDPAAAESVRPTALIAEDADGDAVGFAVLRGGFEIEHLYVVPELHGTGLGAQLLGSAEDVLLNERNCKLAILTVAVRNLQASRFYEKYGWVGTARIERDMPWEPWRPPDLPVVDVAAGQALSQWGLTDEELDATRMRGKMLKKWLGYDLLPVPPLRSY